jgi:hypothetical protein
MALAVLVGGLLLGLAGCQSTTAPPAWIPPHLPVAAPGSQPAAPASWPTTPVARPAYEALVAQNAANLQAQRVELDLLADQARRDAAGRQAELAAMAAAYNTRVESASAQASIARLDFERQDEFKIALLEAGGLVVGQAATGTFNPVSLVPLAIGLLGGAWGLGNKLDNRRKDVVIADLKIAPGNAAGSPAEAKA